jgi:hypothetical protein
MAAVYILAKFGTFFTKKCLKQLHHDILLCDGGDVVVEVPAALAAPSSPGTAAQNEPQFPRSYLSSAR